MTAAVHPTKTPHIVFLVLDEFPVASLIDPDGNLRVGSISELRSTR